MQVLKPMVDELGKKFPKKEDAMKKQQATMDLYKRAGVNPMGGCLPMLLQMPILFAMFRFFPVSIELRQEHFLWATDLSTYDSILTSSLHDSNVWKPCQSIYPPDDCFHIAYNENDRFISRIRSTGNEDDDVYDAGNVYAYSE